jgi:hypothetical protein
MHATTSGYDYGLNGVSTPPMLPNAVELTLPNQVIDLPTAQHHNNGQ